MTLYRLSFNNPLSSDYYRRRFLYAKRILPRINFADDLVVDEKAEETETEARNVSAHGFVAAFVIYITMMLLFFNFKNDSDGRFLSTHLNKKYITNLDHALSCVNMGCCKSIQL